MQIVFKDVYHLYDTLYPTKDPIYALDQVNLDLSDDKVTAIVGHTGSGKSTAMQHINGLLQPTQGSVSVENLLITNKKNRDLLQIRRHIGYVFQNPQYQLFSSTVLEDVMYGPLNFGFSEDEAKKMAIAALETVGVDEALFDRYPFDLSGGQMRKVAIAGSLAYDPKTLIFDEPTVGLDPLTTRQMMELFAKLVQNKNKKLIFITHDMEFVLKLAQRVIVFSEGKVMEDISPHDLFVNNQLMEQYALKQPFSYKLYHELLAKGMEIDALALDFKSTELLAEKIKQGKDAKR